MRPLLFIVGLLLCTTACKKSAPQDPKNFGILARSLYTEAVEQRINNRLSEANFAMIVGRFESEISESDYAMILSFGKDQVNIQKLIEKKGAILGVLKLQKNVFVFSINDDQLLTFEKTDLMWHEALKALPSGDCLEVNRIGGATTIRLNRFDRGVD
jgi:hypothetical protein